MNKKLILIILTVTLAMVAGTAYSMRKGVTLSITNTGKDALQQTEIIVTGARYQVGDIHPGETAKTRVKPTSESSITIQPMNRKALLVDCYLEPGTRGKIAVEVNERGLRVIKQETRYLPF